MPKGITGTYYVHVRTNANVEPSVGPVIWPPPLGSNAPGALLDIAFEDVNNNILSERLTVVYQEPDLRVMDLTVPASAHSGETIPISFSVVNEGTRTTREAFWSDVVFLSRDASLDGADLKLGQALRTSSLKPDDDPYRVDLEVTLPDSIEGGFHILVFADSAANSDASLSATLGWGSSVSVRVAMARSRNFRTRQTTSPSLHSPSRLPIHQTFRWRVSAWFRSVSLAARSSQ